MKKVNQKLLTALVACVNVMETTADDCNGCFVSENESEVHQNALEAIDEAKGLLTTDFEYSINSAIVIKMAHEIRNKFMTSNLLRDIGQVDREMRGYICEMLNSIS